jgi:(2Fe-2S) ferredoxin
LERLAQALAAEADVAVKRYFCFGACTVSPNIVVMPERLWYSYVFPEYVAQVAEAIRHGEALPGLAHHVRSMIQDAVFQQFEQDGAS